MTSTPVHDSSDPYVPSVTDNALLQAAMADSFYTTTGGFTNANDIGLAMLLEGKADGVWIYADQAHNYIAVCEDPETRNTAKHSCVMWEGFGEHYAFIQTGQLTHAKNGTTLTKSRKGSGIPELVNPCIQKFLKTREYYDLCEKYHETKFCYRNEHFPAEDASAEEEPTQPFAQPTRELTTACTDGYCPCSTEASATPFDYAAAAAAAEEAAAAVRR